jgi:lipooligosaccharide transport system permease protein
MGGYRWEGRYFPMVASPATPADVYMHHLIWESLRASVSAVVFLLVAAAVGALASPWAVLCVPSVWLLVVGVAAPVAAFAAWTEDDANFQLVMRFGVLPLFLFSGTFFPVGNLPAWLRHLVPASPLYHGVELCRAAASGHARSGGAVLAHVLALALLATVGTVWGRRAFTKRLAA